ncbi:MAG TPA: serine hydrolase, partial [Bacteroidales bacterium]|nr:serine hydrolase [Bacteroidales bacterium]
MRSNNRTLVSFVLSFLLFTALVSVNAQPITSAEIDNLVNKTLKTFDVPGIAVAVVKDNKVIHAKGYGVTSILTNQPVDANTLFGIASNSKAFTVAALGILVDEKKISWDTKVIDIIPEFRLYSPYVTEDFTIRDMLTHRSGLGLGAGDLMIWPGPTDFTRKDVIYNLRFLKQTSGFRTKYDYDNLMYIVAGEVVQRVSGMSWEDFVETHIMKPLGMTSSAPSFTLLKDRTDVIDPHVPVNGKLVVVDRHEVEMSNSAGGIYSNVNDLSKWVMMHLNDGRYGDNLSQTLLSENVHREMWSPQTIIKVNSPGGYNTHFRSYGLGFNLRDVKGYLEVSHTGALSGMVTQITMIPELKLGIIVLTNQQCGEAFASITSTILDSYLGVKGVDRVKQFHDSYLSDLAYAKDVTDKIWKEVDAQSNSNSYKPDYSVYTGTYTDNWFGDVYIRAEGDRLRFISKRSPKICGDLKFYKGNTFIAKWDDRSLDADAFVVFSIDENDKASGIKMKVISPLTDFSFDFQ